MYTHAHTQVHHPFYTASSHPSFIQNPQSLVRQGSGGSGDPLLYWSADPVETSLSVPWGDSGPVIAAFPPPPPPVLLAVFPFSR